MPRPYRVAFAGATYHISARGNNGEPIFTDAIDRRKYLELLPALVHTMTVRILAYVLMTNHVHLVLQTARPNISEVMQRLHGVYAAYFNRRHGRRGHLFGGRFWNTVIDRDEYLLESTRYVHMNPVRAGLASRPDEYEWSSCRDYLSPKSGSPMVDPMLVIGLLSSNPGKARAAYAAFLRDSMTSWPTGSLSTPDGLQGLVDKVLLAAAWSYDMTLPELRMLKHGSEARAAVFYVTRKITRLPYAELGRRMGFKSNTICKAVARIGHKRERDPLVRDRLDLLENLLAPAHSGIRDA